MVRLRSLLLVAVSNSLWRPPGRLKPGMNDETEIY